MMLLCRAFGRSLLLHLKLRARQPKSWISLAMVPAAYSALVAFLAAGRAPLEGSPYAEFGGGFAGVWAMLLFNASYDILEEHAQGTLALISATRTPLMVVMAGKTAGTLLLGIVPFAISGLTSLLVLGQLPSAANPLAALVCMAAVLASLYALAMLLAPLLAWQRSLADYVNILFSPVLLFSGILFPVSQLPIAVQPVSFSLATTWAVGSFYRTLVGAADVRGMLAPAVVLSCAYIACSWWLFQVIERRMRATGQMVSG